MLVQVTNLARLLSLVQETSNTLGLASGPEGVGVGYVVKVGVGIAGEGGGSFVNWGGRGGKSRERIRIGFF